MIPNLGLFFRAQWRAWFRHRPRLRRWLLVGGLTTLFWLNWWAVTLGRALDWLLFPGFRKQRVEAPLFIVANPRSGTTFTHRLLSLDVERFCHTQLYHTIWPSVTWQRAFAGLGWVDRRTGRLMSRFWGWLERRFFGGWDDIHYMGLRRAEEDEAFFTLTFETPAFYLLFPYLDALREAGLGDLLPARRKRRLMRYYRSCLQRQLYTYGREQTLLIKNTQSCGRIDMLLDEFPDARIVYLVRHPYDAVPSYVSMYYVVWRAHSPELASDARACVACAELAVAYYQKMLALKATLPAERFLDIRYDDLVADPRGTIERLTDHFGIARSPAFEARLAEATAQARRYKSRHEYSLAEFGLSEAWIQERLGPLFEEYGFER